jgi:UDP-3-O-[3-hydroxymyristoyl] N-acetylglucosamine deacetylase
MLRKTILNEVNCKGHCPFNGGVSNVKLCPAKCGNGIRFIRDDLIDKIGEKSIIASNIHANFDCSKLNTTISNGYCEVFVVEHILSSLYAFRITDIDIHVNCNEIPMMDGSSNHWTRAIESACIKEFEEKLECKRINKEIRYEEDNKYIIVRPCNRLKINYTIDFDEPSIGKNTFIYDENINSYQRDISLARTFCIKSQVEQHKALKKDFNNYDMLIYDNNDVFIENKIAELKYNNEATRHKVLDLLGDLMSTGDFFCAEFTCYKSGHAMNRKIINLIYNQKILAN